jgi:hypothetical protein
VNTPSEAVVGLDSPCSRGAVTRVMDALPDLAMGLVLGLIAFDYRFSTDY